MAAQAPYLPLQPPIALAPADRIRLHDYAITARDRRNACRSPGAHASSPAPPSPSRPSSISRGTPRGQRGHGGDASQPEGRRSQDSGRDPGRGRVDGDALRRGSVDGRGRGLSDGRGRRGGRSADRQSSASSMSGDFGRASSMGRALSNAAETVTMLAGSAGSAAPPS